MIHVGGGLLTELEVIDIPRGGEDVRPKVVAEAPFAWPERQRGVEVQAAGPVGLTSERVACVRGEGQHRRRRTRSEALWRSVQEEEESDKGPTLTVQVRSDAPLLEAPQTEGAAQEEAVAYTEGLVVPKAHHVASHAAPLQHLRRPVSPQQLITMAAPLKPSHLPIHGMPQRFKPGTNSA